ncbi:TPA: hypothetical protein L6A41_35820 [Pseudomonas aeruginosa]|nr:hypothetical protein BG483_25175 [Pseudomonas aeruginosa]OKR58900.1 hypothetical protein BH596_07890 [Pseudomonas aeruginosa]OWI18802.1 hypothetical protein CDC11_20760 [Pseudomonas aeruginosa]PBZ24248.1 hypothetical protein CJT50_30860 [Pseudomonas aeruginosa]RQF40155.1 hypothetical protein IPC266_15740 [Pseudomonas aeruginosa]
MGSHWLKMMTADLPTMKSQATCQISRIGAIVNKIKVLRIVAANELLKQFVTRLIRLLPGNGYPRFAQHIRAI